MKEKKNTTQNDELINNEIFVKKIPKEEHNKILEKVIKNILIAIIVMIYFIIINILQIRLITNIMDITIKSLSMLLLFLGIVLIERAYKKDNAETFISSIEVLVLAVHTLFINYVISKHKFDFRTYILASSYIFAIYYILKTIIIYIKSKKQYFKSLSDISEIVKDEPIVKEATKKNIEKITEENINNEDKKLEVKPKSAKIGKNKTKKEKNTKNDNKSKVEKNKRTTKDSIKKDSSKKYIDEKSTENIQKPKSKRGRKKKEEVENND